MALIEEEQTGKRNKTNQTNKPVVIYENKSTETKRSSEKEKKDEATRRHERR